MVNLESFSLALTKHLLLEHCMQPQINYNGKLQFIFWIDKVSFVRAKIM